MGANSTVVFADLTGSTRVFEAMGNARATETVTRLTQWIGGVCESHGGRVVKSLGDGVFAIFSNGVTATRAVLEMQRNHQKRLQTWPAPLRMELQIGVASAFATGMLAAMPSAQARITQIQISNRAMAFGGYSFQGVGQYEVITGIATGEVNPTNLQNSIITTSNSFRQTPTATSSITIISTS